MIKSSSIQKLLQEIEESGQLEMSVQPYQGSVGAVVGTSSAWTLALLMADLNAGEIDLTDFPAPVEVPFGSGQIYYWPSLKWEAE